jgi:hypothetical protein
MPIRSTLPASYCSRPEGPAPQLSLSVPSPASPRSRQ